MKVRALKRICTGSSIMESGRIYEVPDAKGRAFITRALAAAVTAQDAARGTVEVKKTKTAGKGAAVKQAKEAAELPSLSDEDLKLP